MKTMKKMVEHVLVVMVALLALLTILAVIIKFLRWYHHLKSWWCLALVNIIIAFLWSVLAHEKRPPDPADNSCHEQTSHTRNP
jgi:hypothetical protein